MKTCMITLTLLLASAAVTAPAQTANKPDMRAEISKKFPGTTAEDVKPSPVPGIVEVMRGTDMVYVSADGKFAIAGDMYDLNNQNSNLSERRRREVRQRLLAKVPDTQALVFAPKAPKHTVTVFTDVDCGYCRQLHNQITKYNDLGIKVRYLFYPRGGPDSESWVTAEQVWCSSNRNEALTKAKRGDTLKVAKCAGTPVARDYELGQDLGLRGTPGIFLPNGELLPGYVPPAVLLSKLQAMTAAVR